MCESFHAVISRECQRFLKSESQFRRRATRRISILQSLSQPRVHTMSADQSAASKSTATYPSLRGRSVFITGGGSGIGAAFTEGFARQGSKVAFIDINEAASEALVAKIEKAGMPR